MTVTAAVPLGRVIGPTWRTDHSQAPSLEPNHDVPDAFGINLRATLFVSRKIDHSIFPYSLIRVQQELLGAVNMLP